MKKTSKVSIVILSIALMLGMTGYVRSASSVDLDTASGFAVLAGAAISDTAVASNVTGDVGLSPTGGTAITQLSCTNMTGTIYDTNGGYTGGYDSNTGCLETDATLLTTAKADVSLAYNDAKTQSQNFAVTASQTDSFAGIGYVLSPGVYNSGSTMGVPANLTLDGGGDPSAVFIFQAGSTLHTVSGSTISLINGARAGNVFWQVGSSVTLGTGSTFEGTIMAAVSITDDGGSTIHGRLLADADNTDADSTGAVTLNNTTVIVPTTLHVVKAVVNDNGGTAVASDFNLHVKLSGIDVAGSPTVGTVTPGTLYSLAAGTYVVSEDANASYSQSFSGDCDASGNIILSSGDDKTCTITNNDIAPQLIVNKVVINDNGGTKVIADFPLFVDGIGVTSGVATTTTIGSHTVSETTDPGYTATIGGDCATDGTITLALGDVKTCTITNNDISPAPATLHVVKTVVNDNGGTAVASDFTIDVAGTNVSSSSFAGSEAGVDVTLDAGSYAVTETSLPGYSQSGSGDCTGTITAGETKTCTITNDDIAPQLIVNKVVVNDNDNAENKVISDFSLFIDDANVVSGVATTTTVGAHTVSETADSGYDATIGGDCAADGTITLALGDVKTCTVTNDDVEPPSGGGPSNYVPVVPPLIDLVKVPNPLALPNGPGPVEYTYTLDNIGTVPVTDITMVGDTCDPIVRVSGDTNSDNKLDVSETWTYTCSTTLSKTHTNIVTATGRANDISATDIASATVIVGIPVVPPLIHVTKVPSPLVLSAGGGTVAYTYKVTNPGTVALSNVRLVDDKCSSVKYGSGDVNGNVKLDTDETWTYACSTKLTKTTVNTVTASGDANGLTAKDFAIATVVVNAAIPKLPNTGLPLSENTIPWSIIASAGILTIVASLFFVRRKQTA